MLSVDLIRPGLVVGVAVDVDVSDSEAVASKREDPD